MKIAIIPARGGSNRIPRKNIKSFFGSPMISYAINVARDSEVFDEIIVSTDDSNIATIATRLGARVPFVRPKEFSDDFSSTVDVIVHAIRECESLGWNLDSVCCIYPCVPFLTVEDLLTSLTKLSEHPDKFIFPVCRFSSPLQRALGLDAQGHCFSVFPEFSGTRTQDLPEYYFDTGQFYIGNRDTWMRKESIHQFAHVFVIPSWRVVDIDTQEDWLRAEYLYQALLKLQNENSHTR